MNSSFSLRWHQLRKKLLLMRQQFGIKTWVKIENGLVGLLKLDRMGCASGRFGWGWGVSGGFVAVQPQFGLRNDGTRVGSDGSGGCSCNHHIVDVASSILT